MSDAWVNEFIKKFQSGEFTGLITLVKDSLKIKNGFLYMKSPFSNDESIAIRSRNKQGSQIIIFHSLLSDEVWALIQGMNFADVVVNEKEFIVLTDDFFVDQVEIARSYMHDCKDVSSSQAHKFDGFLLNNNRPYHYFYDGLKSLFALRNSGICYNVASDDGFYDITKLGFTITSISSEKVYVKPSIIGQNYSANNKSESLVYMSLMEKNLSDNAVKTVFFKAGQFSKVFWLGITGQKRSWVEQIDGYSNIISLLDGKFPGSLFVIDGMTSSISQRLESVEENLIIDKIKKNVANLSCTVFAMQGFNYEEKISIANNCSYYVANSGTGCMVPQRICSIPGVTHSNGSLFAFMDHEPLAITKTIDKSYIVPVGDSEQPKMFQSYSIPWQSVYNSLVEVINENEGLDIKYEKVPVDYKPKSDDVSLSNHLILRASKHGVNKNQLVEILKDLSLILEKSDNRASAFEVMKYALLIRPNGKYIINKIKSLL